MTILTRPPRPTRGPFAEQGDRCLRCYRPATILHWCKQHAEKVADERVARYVKRRDGACVFCADSRSPLDAAHIFRRRLYYRLRWQPRNLLAACRPCHSAFDLDRPTGRKWLREARPGLLEELEDLKERLPPPDIAEVIVRYAQ